MTIGTFIVRLVGKRIYYLKIYCANSQIFDHLNITEKI